MSALTDLRRWVAAAWADRQTWPHVRIELSLTPWDWRLRPYLDASSEPRTEDRAGSVDLWVCWLGLKISAGANVPVFTSEPYRGGAR